MMKTTLPNAKFFAISANNVAGLFILTSNTKNQNCHSKIIAASIPEESYCLFTILQQSATLKVCTV